MIGLPTSYDIYLEQKGKRVAVVQSYSAKSTDHGRHVIRMTKLYFSNEAIRDGLNFHDLEDFSLVICKPDRKIIYSGCQWSAIGETGALGAMVVEKITIMAARRIETAA